MLPSSWPVPASGRRALRAGALVAVSYVALACGRLPFQLRYDYPAVGLAPGQIVGPNGDTLWTRQVGMVTVVSPVPAAFDSGSFVALDGAAGVHQRLLGVPPRMALTAVLLRAPRPGRPQPPRPALPDSLATRPVVWGWYVGEDTVWGAPAPIVDPVSDPFGDRPRVLRPGMVRTTLRPSPVPTNDGLASIERPTHVFPVEFYVAQRWMDAFTAGHAPLPAWLEAGIVSSIAGGDDELRLRAFVDRGVRDAPPLDSLFERRCASAPVPGDPPAKGLPVSEEPPERVVWGPWLRDRCGYHLRVQAHAVLAYLVEQAGPGVVRALVEDAWAERPIEATLARFPGVPTTRAGLDAAWRVWVKSQH